MNHHARTPVKTARLGFYGLSVALSLACVSAFAVSAQAATLCVDQQGKPDCSTTISAAVTAAAPGDTINVDPGTYREDVVIGKPLSLVGANNQTTIIDATSLPNGVYVDGFDNPGLQQVIVTGFTVRDANFEGILVQEADDVTIWGNNVIENDKSLQPTISACPGMPIFETGEGDDCGEGIHLIGVTHSTVSSNDVERNAGGILVSDETSTTHDNVITHNLVQNNPYDCGITIASHPEYGNTTAKLAYGNYNNTVSDNDSIHNGFGSPGGGAGVGLYAAGPGERTYANTVVGNRLINNALPGVAIHNHTNISLSGAPPNPDVSRNAILDNYISGNGPDPDVPTTVPTGIGVLGITPVVDLVVSGNTIVNESIDVAFNSASTLDLHLNNLGSHVGVANINPAGLVNARENWWGCAGGPGAWGCSSFTGAAASVSFNPWLTKPAGLTFGLDLNFLHHFDFGQDCDHDQDQDHH